VEVESGFGWWFGVVGGPRAVDGGPWWERLHC